jgi:hypothetical protein
MTKKKKKVSQCSLSKAPIMVKIITKNLFEILRENKEKK